MQDHRSPIDHHAPYGRLTSEAQSQARAMYQDAENPRANYAVDRDGDVRGRSFSAGPSPRRGLTS